MSADTKEMSLARPTKLPAPKRAETFKDLGPSNENREGQRKNADPAYVSADRTTTSLGDSVVGLCLDSAHGQGLNRGSPDDEPDLGSEDTDSHSEPESEEDEEV